MVTGMLQASCEGSPKFFRDVCCPDCEYGSPETLTQEYFLSIRVIINLTHFQTILCSKSFYDMLISIWWKIRCYKHPIFHKMLISIQSFKTFCMVLVFMVLCDCLCRIVYPGLFESFKSIKLIIHLVVNSSCNSPCNCCNLMYGVLSLQLQQSQESQVSLRMLL